jgi:hypothetical protein
VQAPEAPHPLVASALKCAISSERGTRYGQELGTFLADTLSPLPAAAALLQYSLPAHFGVQPLMARLCAGWVEQAKRQQQQPKKQQQQGGAAAVVLLSVQYHIPREFQLAANGESACCLFGFWGAVPTVIVSAGPYCTMCCMVGVWSAAADGSAVCGVGGAA